MHFVLSKALLVVPLTFSFVIGAVNSASALPGPDPETAREAARVRLALEQRNDRATDRGRDYRVPVPNAPVPNVRNRDNDNIEERRDNISDHFDERNDNRGLVERGSRR